MISARANRAAAAVAIGLSSLAFMVVLAAILAGVPPQPDENGWAHLWQLLMAAQVPLLLLFLLSADWKKGQAVLLFALQLAAIGLACLPVWLAGY
jgi:hypothetical protein